MENNKLSNSISRREFLRIAGGVTSAGLTYFLLNPGATPIGVLPPGALPEDEFRQACLRCSRCAIVCEQQAIQIDVEGLPYIDGLSGWCDLSMRCVETCPSGALQLIEPETVKLGIAVIDQDRCIAWNWPGCRLCYEKCLKLQSAIALDEKFRPEVDASLCNGCGACVYVCPQSSQAGRNREYGKAVALQA